VGFLARYGDGDGAGVMRMGTVWSGLGGDGDSGVRDLVGMATMIMGMGWE